MRPLLPAAWLDLSEILDLVPSGLWGLLLLAHVAGIPLGIFFSEVRLPWLAFGVVLSVAKLPAWALRHNDDQPFVVALITRVSPTLLRYANAQPVPFWATVVALALAANVWLRLGPTTSLNVLAYATWAFAVFLTWDLCRSGWRR